MKLYSTKLLHRRAFAATDGEIGHCSDILIDDRDWTIRYLVVDTGRWLPGRQVVLSPFEIARHGPLGADGLIQTKLTREAIEESPPLQEHAPISRRLETQLAAYYGWPAYWEGGALWGDSTLLPSTPMPAARMAVDTDEDVFKNLEKEHHLHSTEALRHYTHHGSDGDFGHATDFLFDPGHWQTRFTIIKTGHWFGGRTRAFPMRWISRVEVLDKTIHTDKTRADLEACPEAESSKILDDAASEDLIAHFE